MAPPFQDAPGAGAEREQVAWPGEVLGGAAGINDGLDRVRSIVGRDSRCYPFLRIDRDYERGALQGVVG